MTSGPHATSLPPPMVSYAQNAEDVVLERAFREVDEGWYVDIGASDPVVDSVTHHFYSRGWRGVNVEPDAGDFARLVDSRTRDVNLQSVVGDGDAPLEFYLGGVRGHGTTDSAIARTRGQHEILVVPQLTLARLFDEHVPSRDVEFLKIDVEGAEAAVVASGDWRRHRPRVVVVEAVDDDGNPTHEAWEPILLDAGYSVALFDGLNRFYCRAEDAAELLPRLSAPANVRDNWRAAREVVEKDRLLEQVAGLTERFVEVSEKLVVVSSSFEHLSAEMEARTAELHRSVEALDATRKALLDSEQARADAEHARELAESRVAEMWSSTSWRLTRPIRGASRAARLVRRGRAAADRARPPVMVPPAARVSIDADHDPIFDVVGVPAAEIVARARAVRAQRASGEPEREVRATAPQQPRAPRLIELADVSNEEFVRRAHLLLLDRAPSTPELTRRVFELERGSSRARVLLRLALSPEGRRATRPPTSGFGLRALAATSRAVGRAEQTALLSIVVRMIEKGARRVVARAPGHAR